MFGKLTLELQLVPINNPMCAVPKVDDYFV